MLNTETNYDDDLENKDIEQQNHDDDFDDGDNDDDIVTLSKSELAELQRKAEKADKLAKTVKHHKDRRRQETRSTPNVSELVQKELQLLQERQKIQETYPNIDIAKAEATAREKELTLEQAVFVEFGKDLMSSRGTAGSSIGGNVITGGSNQTTKEKHLSRLPKELQEYYKNKNK